MKSFVTLFDEFFLPQGLSLYLSMQREIKNFNLWILCLDQNTFDILNELNLENIKLLNLKNFENKELLKVKKNRTKTEYCWTLTPFVPDFVFQSDLTISQVTYLDADIWFRADPISIFEEFNLSEKSVMITDHSYYPIYDSTKKSGKFCVQFMIFNRIGSENILKHWQNQCLDWCYSRYEDDKFGDQKYLDNWPNLFSNEIHILKNKETALAPWNVLRFPYGNSIFFHFHGLRIISNKKIYIGNYLIPETILINIYKLYFVDLKNSISLLKKANSYIFKPQINSINIIQEIYYMILRFVNFIKLFFNRLVINNW
jgi:hypothetical protein